MRLFFAIPLPDEAQQALGRHAERLRALGVSGRFVPTGNFHITLRFLGERGDDWVPVLHRATDTAQIPAPFLLTLGRHGSFPAGMRHTLWQGVAPSTPLRQLHAALEEVLVPIGIPFEGKRFFPHITLAREVGLPLPAPALDTACPIPGLTLPVDRFSLFESKSVAGKLRYLPLFEKTL